MKVGITHGDFNGANYEILLRLFEDSRLTDLFTPVIYGVPSVAAKYRKMLETEPVSFHTVADADAAKKTAVNLVDISEGKEPEVLPGQSTAEAGALARKALEQAVADLKRGAIDVLVTAPINKSNIQADNFDFPGHTEYLENRLGEPGEDKALMILCTDHLRVALVSGHTPLKDVAASISREKILEKLRLFNRALEEDFSLPHPRIAVLALNPHAGDNNLLGTEETEIIIPAIEEAQKEGIMAFGPYPSDGFFGSDNYRKFDGILAMYHDQGLIPFKSMAMDSGVNFTAGLPYVRTSPDHGTAYDIAGKGVASIESMRAAIYMAIDLKRRRDVNRRAASNPLKNHYNTTANSRE